MWSGAWSLTVELAGTRLRAAFGLTNMSTTVPPLAQLDTPHGFFGVGSTRAIRTASALRAFFQHAIRGIQTYKQIRAIQTEASTCLLSAQVGSTDDPPAWDVIQQTSDHGGDTLIFAFQVDPAVASVVIRPKWLDVERTYRVESVDGGLIGEARGAELMASGIEVVDSPVTDAHILILRMLPFAPPAEAPTAGPASHPARTIR